MSVLIRFETGTLQGRVRIFEQASRKQTCMCCGRNGYGVLLRFVAPRPAMDRLICNDCLVRMARRETIEPEDTSLLFGAYPKRKPRAGKRPGPKKKPGPKPKKAKKKPAPKTKPALIQKSIATPTSEVSDAGTQPGSAQ